MKQAKQRWAGHTDRINDNRWTTRIMDCQPKTGTRKEVDRAEDGEMTLWAMQEQHGPELQEIKANGIYMRRGYILHWMTVHKA